MTTTLTLTKDQTINLLLNAYGFAHANGMLYSCHESLIEEDSFTLQAAQLYQDDLQFSFDGATLCNTTVVFNNQDGTTEYFTVLIAAAHNVSIDGQSVMDHLLN